MFIRSWKQPVLLRRPLQSELKSSNLYSSVGFLTAPEKHASASVWTKFCAINISIYCIHGRKLKFRKSYTFSCSFSCSFYTLASFIVFLSAENFHSLLLFSFPLIKIEILKSLTHLLIASHMHTCFSEVTCCLSSSGDDPACPRSAQPAFWEVQHPFPSHEVMFKQHFKAFACTKFYIFLNESLYNFNLPAQHLLYFLFKSNVTEKLRWKLPAYLFLTILHP